MIDWLFWPMKLFPWWYESAKILEWNHALPVTIALGILMFLVLAYLLGREGEGFWPGLPTLGVLTAVGGGVSLFFLPLLVAVVWFGGILLLPGFAAHQLGRRAWTKEHASKLPPDPVLGSAIKTESS